MLSSIDVPISAARIRAELDLPRSTTYHLLKEMVAAGFVVHLPEQQTYGLGLHAYSMAQAYTRQQPLVRLSAKPLQEAATLVGGSGHLSHLSGSEIVYLQEIRAQGAVSLITAVGVRLPAVKTASGRIMLAHLPEVEARALYSTSGATGSFQDFRRLLIDARQRGWASESEEVSRGQESVAVAILDHLSRPAAALAVTYPSGVAGTGAEQAREVLHRAAQRIERQMYGVGA
ncbi:IclR family transcriptional regulator [Corynebacterium tapiri]